MAEFEVVVRYFPVLLAGAVTTLQLSSVALVIGTVLGLLVGLLRSSRRSWIRWPATGYIGLFRSVPILIQLFFVYYALPLLLGVNIASYPAAVIALGLYCSGYMAEVVRGGLESVAKGQWEAANSLGLHYTAALRYVVLPQALRVAIPPAISVYVFTIKDSSLASVIGFLELTGAGLSVRESSYGVGAFGVLLVVAGMYFVMAYALSLAGQYVERRIRI